MTTVFCKFPQEGVIAIFEEAPGGGDVEDINSLRNRPAKDPENWLPNILFHSGLSYLEIAAEGTVIRSHSSAPAASYSSGGGDTDGIAAGAYGYGSTYEDFAVVTHNLGYECYAAVIFDGKVLHPGIPVQVGSTGEIRYATAYSTTTQIRVKTWCSIGQSVLPSTSITYKAIALRDPRTATGNILWEVDDTTGIVQMGRSKFSSDRKYLLAVDGGSPFSVLNGRGGDTNNGAARLADGGGGVTDTVPSTSKMAIVSGLVTGDADPNAVTPTVYGSPMVYGGSFASPSSFQIRVPDDPPGGNSGYEFDPDDELLKFFYHGRETLTTSGKLVGVLDEQVLSPTVSFPDFTTYANYVWGYRDRSLSVTPPFEYYYDRWGGAWRSAIPAEWSQVTNLMAVPSGSDFAIGLVKITRTNAPDDWLNDPVEVLPEPAVWIPFMGSFTTILEAAFGMVRMVSIYVEGGYLKLWQSQSVSNAPGGYQTFNLDFTSGGQPRTIRIQHYGGSGAGVPVKMVWNSSTKKYTGGGPVTITPATTLHKWDGSSPPSPPSDPDFASDYTFNLKFRFGRRS